MIVFQESGREIRVAIAWLEQDLVRLAITASDPDHTHHQAWDMTPESLELISDLIQDALCR